MHEAGVDNPGTMAAVLGLDDEDVEIACGGPTATSGWPIQRSRSGGDRRILRRSRGRGAVAKEWARAIMPCRCPRVPHPFRSRPGTAAQAIAEANPRDTESIISNVDALPHDTGDVWASLLSAQLSSPVRWKQCFCPGRLA